MAEEDEMIQAIHGNNKLQDGDFDNDNEGGDSDFSDDLDNIRDNDNSQDQEGEASPDLEFR